MTSRTINLNSLINGTIDCSNNVIVYGTLDCINNITSLTGLKIKCIDTSLAYTITNKDYLINVNTVDASGNVDITLPLASTVPKQIFYITDGSGNCNAKNISIKTINSNKINGKTSLIMNTNYMTVGLLSLNNNYTIFTNLSSDIGSNNPYWGSFYDTSNQLNDMSINKIRYNTTDDANGISIVNNSRITFMYTGIYNISFSGVFNKTTSDSHVVNVWIRKNNVNITSSNIKFIMAGKNRDIESTSFMLSIQANDYLEICWYTTDNTVFLEANEAISSPEFIPSIPSTILSVHQVR
jgi:hypothetical protein